MFNLKTTLAASLLSLAMCAGAIAAPLYHVTIDTSRYGGTGHLDLALGAEDKAAPVTATLTNFSTLLGSAFAAGNYDPSGSVMFMNGALRLKNDVNISDAYVGVAFGGAYSFDVSFDGNGDTGGNPIGTSFYASLYDADGNNLAGLTGPAVQIDLNPGQPDTLTGVAGVGSVAAVDAAAVPEPSTLLSMVTGLGLLGAGLRRRMR
jgi:hypothetical protein